jgi:hypothetical protein
MSTEWLVGLGAGLGTFIASVMADDQRERLRNGTFGAIAGSFIGGLAALLSKNQNLVFVGVFGSAAGAVAGWLVYLALAYLASKPDGRRLVEYHINGLKGVTAQLAEDDKARLLAALNNWFGNYGRLVDVQRDRLVAQQTADNINQFIAIAIESWIRIVTDTFNLVLDALAEKRQYRSRITVIVFGKNSDGKAEGRHWKHYSGALPAHRNKPFDMQSVAYKVLAEIEPSPSFTTSSSADKRAQNRNSSAYHSFMVLRINDRAVISLDWPAEFDETDQYIQVMRSAFQLDIAPAMARLLECWKGDVAQDVGLNQQPTRAVRENPPIVADGTRGKAKAATATPKDS